MTHMYDVAIIGGGIAGFTTAMRLQHKGLKTIVLEAHGQPGGCAGFYTHNHFSFDVGATTLVDFIPGGVGGKFFDEIGLELPEGEYIDYIAWLPDRTITLYKDREKWLKERKEKLGGTEAHERFWKFMDEVTGVFWNASRKNIKLPLQSIPDILHALNVLGIGNSIKYSFYLNTSMLDVVKKFGLENDKALVGFLSMLIEDTVHSTIDQAPFINAALGTTIRGAGLMRAKGGMKGLWNHLTEHYQKSGGVFKRGHRVQDLSNVNQHWKIETTKGTYQAKKIVSSLPLDLTYKISPLHIKSKLAPHIQQNEAFKGSAIVVFLAVPEEEVLNQPMTHHQILHTYDAPLGNGNNMFISVSAKDDLLSAPLGHRAVMLSTHCGVEEWMNLSEEEYQQKKNEIGERLISIARKVYPQLAKRPMLYEVGTPQTYQKYTHRINGSVGGYKQTLKNSNLKAVPKDIGEDNFWLVGDTTWPGLGTVAGILGSKLVSDMVLKKV